MTTTQPVDYKGLSHLNPEGLCPEHRRERRGKTAATGCLPAQLKN